jgi:hypothetical protein
VQLNLEANFKRGFPGMFGSLDCTHLHWDKCPVQEHGQYLDRDGNKSVVMEAVAGHDLWIWHAYIGIPGSNNDINIVNRSPLTSKLLKGVAPHVQYKVNGNDYSMAYLLVDGIYPNWPVFLKTISQPQGEMQQHYAKVQESIRKDVERAFGVLQARFAMLKNPCRLWECKTIITFWTASVILHNMIIEDERATNLDDNYLGIDFVRADVRERRQDPYTFDRLIQDTQAATDSAAFFRLRNDVMSELWLKKGEE